MQMHIFSTVINSTLALSGIEPWSSTLLATSDFSRTVQLEGHNSGDYLRPVHWILSSNVADNKIDIVLLSPYEVNDLLPEIRDSENVHLHMYTPRVTQAMQSLENLRLYCIPPLRPSWRPPPSRAMDQLNIWAGQLYLADHPTYERLCRFLGLTTEEIQCQRDIPRQVDGFITPEHRDQSLVSGCAFERSPIPFLKELFAFRRKDMGYSLTHIGKILGALPLAEEDFPL